MDRLHPLKEGADRLCSTEVVAVGRRNQPTGGMLRSLVAWLLHRRRRRDLDLDRGQLRRFTVSPLPRFSRRLQRRSLSSSQLAVRSSAGFVRWAIVAALTCVVAACTAGSAAA